MINTKDFFMLCLAAALEAGGDAAMRFSVHGTELWKRAGYFLLGGAILTLYGLVVNVPSWNFGKLLGLYVVLFFVFAQILAKVVFHQKPTTPIYVAFVLMVAAGAVLTFSK